MRQLLFCKATHFRRCRVPGRFTFYCALGSKTSKSDSNGPNPSNSGKRCSTLNIDVHVLVVYCFIDSQVIRRDPILQRRACTLPPAWIQRPRHYLISARRSEWLLGRRCWTSWKACSHLSCQCPLFLFQGQFNVKQIKRRSLYTPCSLL